MPGNPRTGGASKEDRTHDEVFPMLLLSPTPADAHGEAAASICDACRRPSRAEAEAAVRTLIGWAGDDPRREGLQATPGRVVRAYEEWFAGYRLDPTAVLERTFGEVAGYDDMVVLRDIQVQSTCEHHMAAIRGVAHVAYLPRQRVVGISKLARVVEIFSRRLQTQETLTQLIAEAIETHLQPAGVAVLIDAEHQCMTTRGVHHRHVSTLTTRFTGEFRSDAALKDRFLKLAQGR